MFQGSSSASLVAGMPRSHAIEHGGDVCLRIEAVELGSFGQGVDQRRPLAAAVRADEQDGAMTVLPGCCPGALTWRWAVPSTGCTLEREESHGARALV